MDGGKKAVVDDEPLWAGDSGWNENDERRDECGGDVEGDGERDGPADIRGDETGEPVDSTS